MRIPPIPKRCAKPRSPAATARSTARTGAHLPWGVRSGIRALRRARLFKLQLHSMMARAETKPLIKAQRVAPLPVGRQLHQRATARAALLDRPAEEPRADAAPAQMRGHADTFQLAAPGAFARQARNEGDLHIADDLPVGLGDRHQLVGVARNGVK